MNFAPDIPTFKDPLPIDLVLASDQNRYLYDDLRQFEHYFLQHLLDNDYELNEPVGLWANSSDELVLIIAACWRLGVPFVSFDPALSTDEFQRQQRQTGIALLITDWPSNADNRETTVIPIDQFSLTHIIKPDFTPEEWVKEHKKKIHPEQVFGYFFTSGTSGTPKIVPLKRRQMLFAAHASMDNLKPGRNHYWLLCMPLNHIGGISLILRSLLYGSAVFRMDTFERHQIADYLSNDLQFQAASLVPTMLKRLMQDPDFQIHENFQAILLGGGPIDDALVEECFQRGIPLITSYGMTESCAQIAANPLMTVGDLSRPKKSVGKLFIPNQIEIRDDHNIRLPVNKSGQIWLKGPQIFDGYLHKNPTHDFDNNGWFNTGDFGYLNEQTELFVEARRTDLIISGGENISPVEVEEALTKLDAIRDAAVVGLPDEEWGQIAVAVVITNHHTLDIEGIRNQLREWLQPFKIPKQIIQVDGIPRTKSGKIKRNKIKKTLFQ